MPSSGVDDMCTKHRRIERIGNQGDCEGRLAAGLAPTQDKEENWHTRSHHRPAMVDTIYETVHSQSPDKCKYDIPREDPQESRQHHFQSDPEETVYPKEFSATHVGQRITGGRNHENYPAHEQQYFEQISADQSTGFIPEELKNMIFQGYHSEQIDIDDYYVIHTEANTTTWQETDTTKKLTAQEAQRWLDRSSEERERVLCGSWTGANSRDPVSLGLAGQVQLSWPESEANGVGDTRGTAAFSYNGSIDPEDPWATHRRRFGLPSHAHPPVNEPPGSDWTVNVGGDGHNGQMLNSGSQQESPRCQTQIPVYGESGTEFSESGNDQLTGGRPNALVRIDGTTLHPEISHASRSQRAAAQVRRNRFKIHLPTTAGQANVEEILSRMETVIREQVNAILNKEETYKTAKLCVEGEQSQFNNRFTKEEVYDMTKSQIIEEVKSKNELVLFCKIFTIEETAKERLRLIIEPRDLNKAFEYPKTKLPTLTDIIKLTQEQKILYQADLECFFYQIPLGESVRKYFGVIINNKPYRLNILPMGFVASVFVAQAMAATLVTAKELNYIDNLFGGALNKKDAEAALSIIQQKAVCTNLRIKQNSAELGETLNILGIHCNGAEKTIQLSQGFINKHEVLMKDIQNAQYVINTVRGMLKILGVLLRTAYVLQIRPFGS
eukprot:GILJ01023499.1.p1 GENE.GILJ01023499.1~~GILJ01023499.1.p1  ORF type:complete len:667 (-),score=54.55 GILJ01023499.1:410-2410(-)